MDIVQEMRCGMADAISAWGAAVSRAGNNLRELNIYFHRIALWVGGKVWGDQPMNHHR